LTTVHVYALTNNHLHLTDLSGPTLDAVSLQLPEGVYTTLRTYERDRVLGLSTHLQRLVDSHAALKRHRPIDLAAIRSAVRDIIRRENLPAARLRITTPFDGDQVFISVEPFESYPAACYTHGVRCATTRLTRDTPQAKQTNFIAPSRTVKAESDSEVHELLLVDDEGRILEGISSNFFALFGGELRTAGSGVLEGVTRRIVLTLAQAIAPIDCTAITLNDLPHADEAFITSSSREVMPIVQIDEQIIGAGQPGPVTTELRARYRMYLMQAAEVP
jgi:branched-chain amino acid aminotransferase